MSLRVLGDVRDDDAEAWRTANAVSMDDRKVLLTSMLVASLDGSIRKDYVAFDHWFCCPPGCFSVE